MARITDMILNVLSLLLVVAGLALISTFFFGSPLPDPVARGERTDVPSQSFNVPVLSENVAPEAPAGKQRKGSEQKSGNVAPVPEDKTLKLTIPRMERVENAVLPYTTGDDEEALRNHAAIHLAGTGFPWQKEANVYVAGHRLGYLNTRSFLAFYDLPELKKGDEIYITDADGRRYVYRVFRSFVVAPTDLFVTRPIQGKNILTLQTCTLPDYSQRLIVQAEKVV